MKAFSRFSGLFVILVLMWLIGCGQDSVIPTEDDVGSRLAAGDSGSTVKNYNPLAGVDGASGGAVEVSIENAFPVEKIPGPEVLAVLDDNTALAAPGVPTIWYRTNAIFSSAKNGFEEGTGTTAGTISLSLIPNERVPQMGYETYWVIPRKGSSSGDFYFWLKLPNGTMPKYAESDGKIHFKVFKDGTVQWVDKGNLILRHTIVVDNIAITSSTKIYIKGDKSTLGQWLEADYVSNSRRQLTVSASPGIEFLEVKDGTGKRYFYKVAVDDVFITGVDNNREALTFRYTDSGGVENTASNLVIDVGLTVAEDGGGVIPPSPTPVDSGFLKIEAGSKLVIPEIDRAPVPLRGAARIFLPNSCNSWLIDDIFYSANVGNNRWEYNLAEGFVQKQREGQIIRFNLFANGTWLIKITCSDHPGWAQVKNKPDVWSLAIVYQSGQWRWWQDVYGTSAQVDENP